ncbi:MAG: DUF6268 family outer membrane beta-barrel protein, partial [Cyclobacteriaceae bacterium]|nr:DUF6268 family outer membrane beta-barrel protein [Cyclobacteriaceae bacterium]
LSLFLKPDNVTYRLSKKEFDSRYFQKKQWSTGLGLEFQMTQHWLFTLRGGFSMRQRFEMYEASETGVFSILTVDLKGGKRTPLYQYSQRNFFTEVVLAWVINKELKTK